MTPLLASPATPTEAADAPPAVRADRASALLGWAALGLVFVVGLPIFLCMPVWFDTYHYDICGRTLLRGGVMYRDVFDNNLPGIIWLQTGVRLLVGWSTEAIRIVDLIFFTIDVLLLLTWVPRGARVWTAVAFYAFYLFVPETCPCERDIWMLLPALVGLTLRRRQIGRLTLGTPGASSVVAWAFLEGLCWAAGVWIKPFVFVPGFACWFVGVFQVERAKPGQARRLLAADAAGLLAGGLLAGALGTLWMWRSGCWPYFWDILLNWNREYASFTNRVRISLWISFLFTYLPWSAVPIAAVCLGFGAIKRELLDPPSPATTTPGHALLAAFFIAWLFQAACLQLPHDYPIVAALIPGIALVAALWRWRRPTSLVGVAAQMLLLTGAAFFWSVAFHLDRVRCWAECCREGSTPHVQSLLATQKDYAYCPDPENLAAVADYLRTQGVGDGELTCMSGCSHPLYLDLGVAPSTRYPQVEMTTLFFVRHREAVLAELNASRQRFIVSDLVWTGLTAEEAAETNPDDPLALPPKMPDKFALMYPWREPVVFRSGRYLVHRVTGPATRFWREGAVALPDAENDYADDFADQSFRDETAARATVAALDELYGGADPSGRYEALRRGVTLREQARAAGKEAEAEVFRRWLTERLGEGASAPR